MTPAIAISAWWFGLERVGGKANMIDPPGSTASSKGPISTPTQS
jgi:hypothetical protein